MSINLKPFPFQLKRFKNGKLKMPGKTKYKWFTSPHRIVELYTEGAYQPVKLKKFEPGSRDKIKLWLKHDLGFEFPTFTGKGNPKVDADSLEGMEHPAGKQLQTYLKLVKDYSQLASGKGALILNYKDELHGLTSNVDTNGTITGRFTSSSINLNQIPAQKEFRELFTAPDGWTFVGTDFDGQENVNLAEALYPYDNGRLDSIITSGDKSKGTDLHSLNAKACGLPRNDAKPLWFGFLYGSSSTLTGYTLLKDNDYTNFTEAEWEEADEKIRRRLEEMNSDWYYPVKGGANPTYVRYTEQLVKQAIFGKHVQSKLVSSTNGLSELIEALQDKVASEGGVTTLGGRFIPVDSSHKALNYFCQGQGAEAMKYYLVTIHKRFKEAGLIHGVHFKQQATIYDEVDFIVRNDSVDTVVNILESSYAIVSAILGMKCRYTGEVLTGPSWQECH